MDDEYLESAIPEAFVRTDVKVNKRRHLIFATDEQLDLLSRAKTWYIDGTFKAPFTQLLSIHAFIKSGQDVKQLQLCFVLMSGRKKKDYKRYIVINKTLYKKFFHTKF